MVLGDFWCPSSQLSSVFQVTMPPNLSRLASTKHSRVVVVFHAPRIGYWNHLEGGLPFPQNQECAVALTPTHVYLALYPHLYPDIHVCCYS